MLKNQNNNSATISPKSKKEFGLFDPVRWIFRRRRHAAAFLTIFIIIVFANAIWLMRGASQKIQEPADDNKIAQNNNQLLENQDDLNNTVEPLPEPTGNIDDAVAELNKFVSEEDAPIANETDDAAAILIDNAAIDDFAAIYQTDDALNSCESLQNFVNQSKTAAVDKTLALAKIQANRLNTIINSRVARDNKLIMQRAFTDSQMEKVYQKLILVAQGSIQKEAAADFKTNVYDALNKRRAALDTAQSTFRQGLDQILSQKMTATKNAADKLQTEITSALNQALANCHNQDVSQQIHDAINLAQTEFANTALSIKSLTADSLIAARAKDLQDADQQFKTAVEQAVKTFKASQF